MDRHQALKLLVMAPSKAGLEERESELGPSDREGRLGAEDGAVLGPSGLGGGGRWLVPPWPSPPILACKEGLRMVMRPDLHLARGRALEAGFSGCLASSSEGEGAGVNKSGPPPSLLPAGKPLLYCRLWQGNGAFTGIPGAAHSLLPAAWHREWLGGY